MLIFCITYKINQVFSIPKFYTKSGCFIYCLLCKILIGKYNGYILVIQTLSSVCLLYSCIAYVGRITLTLDRIGNAVLFG